MRGRRRWAVVQDNLPEWFRRSTRMAHVSARGGIEWLKYGEWRLMRLRLALNHPDYEQMIRQSRERIAA